MASCLYGFSEAGIFFSTTEIFYKGPKINYKQQQESFGLDSGLNKGFADIEYS